MSPDILGDYIWHAAESIFGLIFLLAVANWMFGWTDWFRRDKRDDE